MRRYRAIAFVIAIASMAGTARPEVPLPAALAVIGNVTNSARPVANALVIALNLQDFGATQTWTSIDGTFSIPALRTGIYKIIAVKQGFTPAITTVLPTTPNHRVALKLESEKKKQSSMSRLSSVPARVMNHMPLKAKTGMLAT